MDRDVPRRIVQAHATAQHVCYAQDLEIPNRHAIEKSSKAETLIPVCCVRIKEI